LEGGSGNAELRSLAADTLASNGVEGDVLFCAAIGSTALEPTLGINPISLTMTFVGCETNLRDYVAVYLPVAQKVYNVFHPPPLVVVPTDGAAKCTDKFRRGMQVIEITTFFDALLKVFLPYFQLSEIGKPYNVGGLTLP
jgi:hypothetical protein